VSGCRVIHFVSASLRTSVGCVRRTLTKKYSGQGSK
jgi:hypothetical protein